MKKCPQCGARTRLVETATRPRGHGLAAAPIHGCEGCGSEFESRGKRHPARVLARGLSPTDRPSKADLLAAYEEFLPS